MTRNYQNIGGLHMRAENTNSHEGRIIQPVTFVCFCSLRAHVKKLQGSLNT